MAETFGKKEKENRKQEKKKEKELRKAQRQSKTKSGLLEDMMAYVDENGDISATRPDPNKKNVFTERDMVIGSRNTGNTEVTRTREGRVTYFSSSKGYGFIKDGHTHESIFVHATALSTPVKESDFVSFRIGRGVKGQIAIDVKKTS